MAAGEEVVDSSLPAESALNQGAEVEEGGVLSQGLGDGSRGLNGIIRHVSDDMVGRPALSESDLDGSGGSVCIDLDVRRWKAVPVQKSHNRLSGVVVTDAAQEANRDIKMVEMKGDIEWRTADPSVVGKAVKQEFSNDDNHGRSSSISSGTESP
jgi:hypothetical protein